MDTNRSLEEVTRDVEETRADAKYALRNVGEVWSGRNAIASAWRTTKQTYWRTQDKVADKIYETDQTVRKNVYASVGIALGVGTILGYFMTRKSRRKGKR